MSTESGIPDFRSAIRDLGRDRPVRGRLDRRVPSRPRARLGLLPAAARRPRRGASRTRAIWPSPSSRRRGTSPRSSRRTSTRCTSRPEAATSSRCTDRSGAPSAPVGSSATRDEVTATLERGDLPRCDRCDRVLKPGVVMFGELLPAGAMQRAEAARLRDVACWSSSARRCRCGRSRGCRASRCGVAVGCRCSTTTRRPSTATRRSSSAARPARCCARPRISYFPVRCDIEWRMTAKESTDCGRAGHPAAPSRCAGRRPSFRRAWGGGAAPARRPPGRRQAMRTLSELGRRVDELEPQGAGHRRARAAGRRPRARARRAPQVRLALGPLGGCGTRSRSALRDDLEPRRRRPRLLAVELDRHGDVALDETARPRRSSPFGWGRCVPRYVFGIVTTRSRFVRSPIVRTSNSPSSGSASGQIFMPPPKYRPFATTTSIIVPARSASSTCEPDRRRLPAREHGERRQQVGRLPAEHLRRLVRPLRDRAAHPGARDVGEEGHLLGAVPGAEGGAAEVDLARRRRGAPRRPPCRSPAGCGTSGRSPSRCRAGRSRSAAGRRARRGR